MVVSCNFALSIEIFAYGDKEVVFFHTHSLEFRAVIPKVCSADHRWSARLAEDQLKWSANPYIIQYFVLRGPPNFSKWSSNQKSLGTTGLECRAQSGNRLASEPNITANFLEHLSILVNGKVICKLRKCQFNDYLFIYYDSATRHTIQIFTKNHQEVLNTMTDISIVEDNFGLYGFLLLI